MVQSVLLSLQSCMSLGQLVDRYAYATDNRTWLAGSQASTLLCVIDILIHLSETTMGLPVVSSDGGYSCEQQKEWGQCEKPWMEAGGYCKRTCGFLPCEPTDEAKLAFKIKFAAKRKPDGLTGVADTVSVTATAGP